MTTSEWTPEHEVDAELARTLIARDFPQLRAGSVELLATGWDNTVFLVDDEWVFRFPRRQIAVPGVEREMAVLPLLARRLPLPVPVPDLVGQASDEFPWPYWGARTIRGEELADVRPPEEARVALAGDVGAFLRALHAPSLARDAGEGLPVDPMDRADPAIRAERTLGRLDALVAAGAWQRETAVMEFLAEAAGAGAPDGERVLVHGDLHVRHVLLTRAGRAAGVIDWGDVCLADPAVDLSLAYAGFAGGAREALLAAYGPVPPERDLAARALALNLSATLAEYAASTDRAGLLAESLAGMRRAVGS